MARYNLLLDTDAYHQTMGYLIPRPMEMETHILYHRRGGPQVVADLGETIKDIVESHPTMTQVREADSFLTRNGIPFNSDAWEEIAGMARLPLTVRGVRDGSVVLPGSPMAILRGPALLLGVIEPLLLLRQHASMQTATRFIKVMDVLDWDYARVFEVGLRAVPFLVEGHTAALRILKRVGLIKTSSCAGAHDLAMTPIGTMGHRFTQRYSNDFDAFKQAVERMLLYREQNNLSTVALSLLVDTRSTMKSGVPAAYKVAKLCAEQLKKGELKLSMRFDSGDLGAQLKATIEMARDPSIAPIAGYVGLIFESGLDAAKVRSLESILKENSQPSERYQVSYGIGGGFVGSLDRDQIALCYKLSSYGGRTLADASDHRPTMKIGDEPEGGKTSWPGIPEVVEQCSSDGYADGNARRIQDRLSLRTEMGNGDKAQFHDLCINGRLTRSATLSDAEVKEFARSSWVSLADSVKTSDKMRPDLSPAYSKLVESTIRDCGGR